MNTAFVLRCDGRRDYVERAVATAINNLKGNFSRMIVVNDSGEESYASWLESVLPSSFEFVHHAERKGMNACVCSAFQAAIAAGVDNVFFTEDDFVYPRRVSVVKMARLLHCEPHLAQLVLPRQPWNDEERAAGSIMAADVYVEKSCPTGNWVEGLPVFSGNPSLVRVDAIKTALAEWRDVTDDTYEKPVAAVMSRHGYSFAFYGKCADRPRCEHVGYTRSSGYTW